MDTGKLLAEVRQLRDALIQERAQVIMATRDHWSNATVLTEACAELVAEGLLPDEGVPPVGYNARGEAKVLDQRVLDRNHDTALRIAHERGELPEGE